MEFVYLFLLLPVTSMIWELLNTYRNRFIFIFHIISVCILLSLGLSIISSMSLEGFHWVPGQVLDPALDLSACHGVVTMRLISVFPDPLTVNYLWNSEHWSLSFSYAEGNALITVYPGKWTTLKKEPKQPKIIYIKYALSQEREGNQ